MKANAHADPQELFVRHAKRDGRSVAMLKAIMENQPIGIIRLSELLNFPQHKVRYSLRILEQEGLIKPSPEGAVTTDKLEEFLDYLKGVLDSMSGTVQELRKTLG